MLTLIKIYNIFILILLYNSNSVCMLECTTSYLYNINHNILILTFVMNNMCSIYLSIIRDQARKY